MFFNYTAKQRVPFKKENLKISFVFFGQTVSKCSDAFSQSFLKVIIYQCKRFTKNNTLLKSFSRNCVKKFKKLVKTTAFVLQLLSNL